MRILFLSQRLPYAPNRGDRVRAFYLVRQLRHFAEVDLLSFVHDDEEASHVAEARALASTVEVVRLSKIRNTVRSLLALAGSRPTTHTMLDAPGLHAVIDRIVRRHPPDVVLAFCSGVARLALEPPLNKVPLVLDMVDVDSAKWASLADVARPPRSWIYRREARLLAVFEARAARHAFTTLVTTEKERGTLLSLAPEARVEVVQNGVDAESLKPPEEPAESQTVVFCGVMNYAPNEEGAIWLAREVWPLVRARRPLARLQLVGSNPTSKVRNLASRQDGVEVTGHVPDVRRYLWAAAAAAAPLLTARGVQNKVLEAVAAGLPTVVTPLVLEGVPPEVRAGCIPAQTVEAFAAAIIEVLELPAASRRQLAESTDSQSISWGRRLDRVQQITMAAADARS